MQNRYTGDIGDFGKLGLLRALHESRFSIGVNWYLTPDEAHNSDGRYIKYLDNESFRSCDDKLWIELGQIVHDGKRCVSALERDSILPALYFSDVLDFHGESKAERARHRAAWHTAALNKLRSASVVFVDPDNGLMVPSAAGTQKANKFVEITELADYYAQGASVIYYQHKARRRDDFYVDQQKHLLNNDAFADATGLALKFLTTSQRYYFFIMQPEHKAELTASVHQMLSTPWEKHFCVL